MGDQIVAAMQGELPAWASVFATLLLAVAAAIAQRISRRSARPQGERLGVLEQELTLERTRRRQNEAYLRENYGVELPWWPPDHDGEIPPPPRPLPRADTRDDDDREPSTEYRPSIPPLPDYSHHRR